MRNLTHWQIVIFWYANIASLGLIFLMAWFLDGITPKELTKYVHGDSGKKRGKS